MAAEMRIIGNSTELDQILNDVFVTPARSGYVEIGEDNVCMPIFYKDWEEKIRKFHVRDDDIFLAGHPKTAGNPETTKIFHSHFDNGRVLMPKPPQRYNMIWLIMHNLDFSTASKEVVYKRFPQLELDALFDLSYFDLGHPDYFSDPFGFIERSKSPRYIKTHLHWSLLPENIRNGTKTPKIIVIMRNAEDTCVSLYHHSKVIEGYKGTFETFCELFLAGRVCFGPFWKQVLSLWEQRHRPNLLFIKYKDMKDDLSGVIRKVAEFLEKQLKQEDIEKLSNHLSMAAMKKNPSVNLDHVIEAMKKSGMATSDENSFVRKGEVGGYKSEMSPEMIKRFAAWTTENLEGTGLSLS